MNCIVLYHPDVAKHAFQYPDWQFDGGDIVAAIRTAYDDALGGAQRGHDANYLTFHRIENFRELGLSDSVVDPNSLDLPPANLVNTDTLSIVGRRFTLKELENDQQAFANRNYVWKKVPARFKNWRFTQTSGGIPPTISVTAKIAATVYVAVPESPQGLEQDLWIAEPKLNFLYTDARETKMYVFRRSLDSGQTVKIVQESWSGTLLLVPSKLADQGGRLWLSPSAIGCMSGFTWTLVQGRVYAARDANGDDAALEKWKALLDPEKGKQD